MEPKISIDSTERRYRPDQGEAIATCVLDDITILYHRASGQSHMVISPVPEIMEALGEADSATAQEVRARLARRYDLASAEDVIPEIEAHLDDLLELGLVRRA